MKAVPVEGSEAQPARMERGQAWAWFEGLPEKTKAEARDSLMEETRRSLEALQAVRVGDVSVRLPSNQTGEAGPGPRSL